MSTPAAAPDVITCAPMFRSFRAAFKYHEREIVRGWCWEWIRDESAKGTEITFVNQLMDSVPNEYKDREELEAQVRQFACEAANEFDHRRGTSFNTYLHDYLDGKCANHQRYLWTRSSGNQRCRMYTVHFRSDKRRTHNHCEEIGHSGDEPISLANDFAVQSSSEFKAELSEFSQSLDNEDNDTLDRLLSLASVENIDQLERECSSKRFLLNLEKRGIDKQRVRRLMNNACHKAPHFLTCVARARADRRKHW